MARTPQQELLFESAGQFETNDPLTVFLYHLMRDDLPAGTVAQVVREATENLNGPATLTNGYLGRYAEFLAEELRASAATPKASTATVPRSGAASGIVPLTDGVRPRDAADIDPLGLRHVQYYQDKAAPMAADDDAPDMTPTLGPGPHPERYDCPCAPCVGMSARRAR